MFLPTAFFCLTQLMLRVGIAVVEKDTLVQNILDKEWEMFVRVKSDRPASCQSSPDKFRLIRGNQFETWTREMLTAYWEQLEEADAVGRNLLAEKYARMDNLIHPLTENILIFPIVTINERWQQELCELYPALFEQCCRSTNLSRDGRNFSIYLACELETYGDTVIELYYLNVKRAEDEGRNLAEEALLRLVRASGYRDLEHAERSLQRGSPG